MQERGSREAFVESFKDNVTMIRRRVRNPVFKTQVVEIGTTSKTRACVCYMSDRVDKEMLDDVVKRLKNSTVDTVLGSGYMQSFLDTKYASIFSGVGFTQRPDVLTAKISEAKSVLSLTEHRMHLLCLIFLSSIFIQWMIILKDLIMQPLSEY